MHHFLEFVCCQESTAETVASYFLEHFQVFAKFVPKLTHVRRKANCNSVQYSTIFASRDESGNQEKLTQIFVGENINLEDSQLSRY